MFPLNPVNGQEYLNKKYNAATGAWIDDYSNSNGGAAISDWTACPVVLYNLGSGAITANSWMEWRRNGSSMDIRGSIQKDSVAGSGTGIVSLQIPDGKTADPSKSVFSGGWTLLGVDKGSNFISAGGSNSTISFRTNSSAILGQQWLANTSMEFGVSIPIAQWAGSGTVGLVQNYEEYASNSDVSSTASVTGSGFLQGFGNFGGFGSGWGVGTTWIRRGRFQCPIQWGRDDVDLYLRNKSTGVPIVATASPAVIVKDFPLYNNEYGYSIRPVSGDPYAFDLILWGGGMFPSGSSLGASGNPFSTLSSTYEWFVKKTSAGKPGETLPCVYAEYTGSDNVIPNTTGVTLQFNTKVADTNSIVTTGANWTLTFPYDGKYIITVQGRDSTTNSTTQGICATALWYRKLGGTLSVLASDNRVFLANLMGCQCNFSTTVDAKAGDQIYFSISASGNTGGGMSNRRVTVVSWPGK